MLWVMLLSAVAVLLALFLLRRIDEGKVRRDWEALLAPDHELRELGAVEEAIRLLDLGYEIIRRSTPTPLNALGAMAVFSRMVSGMTTVPPPQAEALRVGGLATLARLRRMLEQFLLMTGERFRLHLYIVGRSLGLLASVLGDRIRRIGSDPAGDSKNELWQLAERREQWRDSPPTRSLILWAAFTCALLFVLAL
jgi:hypothetical protein